MFWNEKRERVFIIIIVKFIFCEFPDATILIRRLASDCKTLTCHFLSNVFFSKRNARTCCYTHSIFFVKKRSDQPFRSSENTLANCNEHVP